MSLTFSQSQGNGSTLSYTIVAEGGYFEDTDIVVELISVSDGTITEQTLGTHYSIEDGNVIFVTAPTSDYYVRIRRLVSNEDTYSDFTRGNAFGADNLNRSFLFALYQMQQLADGFLPDDHYLKANLNAGSQKITNLADGEAEGDAVNYGQVEELIAAVDETSEYADAAAASATAAAASASAASDSEDASAASATTAESESNNASSAATIAITAKNTALTYSSNASTSASNAATSASSAATSATNAATSATAAAASATAASTSASSAASSASSASTYASDASTSATAAASSATAAAASAVAAAASAELLGFANVMDFGALGNGAQDDTTYIQAAIDSLSSTGGTVYLPPGTYRTTAALKLNTNGVTIEGAGRMATIISMSTATQNGIEIGNYTTLTKNNRVTNVQITSSVTKTAGAAILVRNGHQTDIDRVTLMSNMYYGFQFEGGSSQYIYHLSEFEINSGLNGIIVGHEYTSYSGSICQGLVCTDGDIANVTGVAIKLEHISGGFFRNIDIISSYEGVGMLPPTGCAVQACWFDTVLGDTCTNNGWEMTPSGTGFVKEIMLVSCWASSNTNYGILIDSSAGAGLISGVTLTGCRLTGNYKTGLYITTGVKAISISNLHCIGNSRSGSGSYPGVYLATGVDGVNFNGGVCGAGGLYTNYQSYGIYFAGTATNCSIVGVNVSGNITGGIRDTGITAGNTLIIESCVGHKTRNSGSCTITAGNTTVVVSHGLASTPAIAEISLAHSLNPKLCSAGGYQAWVTNVTSTTFTVNVSEAITSQTWLYWKVKTR